MVMVIISERVLLCCVPSVVYGVLSLCVEIRMCFMCLLLLYDMVCMVVCFFCFGEG